MSAPLSGLKVVDFSKFLPGPYCTWMLADLGAEVIRIENPRELAKQRKVFGWDRLSEEENARLRAHDIFTRGKKSVLLDPGAEACRAAIHDLIAQADILVEDYRPGVMESMGYGWEAMAALNPRLIYCSVTLCGQTGPYARKPGHDPVALAIAGALSRIGEDAERPGFPGVPVADLLSGSNAVIGILSAVIARAATGRGQRVDIAMSDASMALIATVLSRNPDLSRAPPRGMHRADSGIWRTSDITFFARSGRSASSHSRNRSLISRGRRRVTYMAEVAPASAARSSTASISWSFRPGITGAKPTPTGTPASASARTASSRRSGVAARGSMARASLRSRVVIETKARTRPRPASEARMSASRTISADLVMMLVGWENRSSTSSTSRVMRKVRSAGW